MTRYSGGCQCGKVRYEAEVDLSNTVACNCSRCGKIGSILTFTGEDKFTLLQGADALTQYNFNKHKIDHLFCATCGIQSFSRGTAPNGAKMVAVNARCLDGVDPFSLTPKQVDGKSF